MLILIDGDVFLFTTCSACQIDLQWGQDDHTVTIHMDEARGVFNAAIDSLKESFNTGSVLIALSGDRMKNWRRDVMPGYKSHRSGRKPPGYRALESWVKQTYSTVCFDNLEADDCLGIYHTATNPESVVVSIDKDMFTLPGKFARLKNHSLTEYEFHDVSEEEARLYHLKQALIGDKTDGYPGCPGVGEVSAEKVLKDGTWAEIVSTYEKKGLSEEVALENARVARILHHDEYNVKTGRVSLWSPK